MGFEVECESLFNMQKLPDHEPPDESGPYRRGLWSRLKQRWRASAFLRCYYAVADRVADFWHPRTHPGINRWQLSALRFGRWRRNLSLSRGGRGVVRRIVDFWYPPTDPGFSRLDLVWLRLGYWWRNRSLARRVNEVARRMGDFWNPPSHPHLNRLQLTWHRIARRLSTTAAGRVVVERVDRVSNYVGGWIDRTTLADVGLGSASREYLMKAAEKACAPEQPIHHEAGIITADKVLNAMLAVDAIGQARKGSRRSQRAGAL